MFPQRLKELRKSRRVSQRALAAALGVTQQAVGKWEMGRSTPDPATIARIADFFGASADYLLGCSGQRQGAAFSAGGRGGAVRLCSHHRHRQGRVRRPRL